MTFNFVPFHSFTPYLLKSTVNFYAHFSYELDKLKFNNTNLHLCLFALKINFKKNVKDINKGSFFSLCVAVGYMFR